MEKQIKITHELIESGKSQKGGWSKNQLEALGVSWPPKKGWKKNLVQSKVRISQENRDKFLQLKNLSTKKSNYEKHQQTLDFFKDLN